MPSHSLGRKTFSRRWSRQEFAFLCQYYYHYNTDWIASQLDRTVKAVRTKANEEGLVKGFFPYYLQPKGTPDAFKKHSRGRNRFNTTLRKSV